MKTKHTTLMIKIDRITVQNLLEVTTLAVKHRVPENASVSIRTDATGTNIIFEWVESDLVKKQHEKTNYPNYYKPFPPNETWTPSKKPF